MPFTTPVGQPVLDSRCLGFFVFDEAIPQTQSEYDAVPAAGGPGRAALTYSLETGVVSARHPVERDRFAVALRDNARLASWEPMTSEKLGLLAVELGVWSGRGGLPAAVSEPAIGAVVVSPEGYVIHWDDVGNIAISDVRRLANYPDTNIVRPHSADAWSMYRAQEGHREPGADRLTEDVAHLGNSFYPKILDYPAEPNSLVDCCGRAIAMIQESDNDPYAQEFHPGAADFVQHQFGVDVSAIDWREASKARIIGAPSIGQSSPFDATAACSAMRLAALSARAQATLSAGPVPGGPSPAQLARMQQQARQPKPGR